LAGYGRLRATTGGHRDGVDISRMRERGRGQTARGQPDSRDKQTDSREDGPIHSNATLWPRMPNCSHLPLLVALALLLVQASHWYLERGVP
jgi:hypothetical protein